MTIHTSVIRSKKKNTYTPPALLLAGPAQRTPASITMLQLLITATIAEEYAVDKNVLKFKYEEKLLSIVIMCM